MKIICISDTHRRRPEIKANCDMLIFAGDDDINDIQDLVDFVHYIKKIKCKYYVMIAGNHDWIFEHQSFAREYLIENDVIYLQDETIEIEGLKIYGTPYTGIFCNWAFMETEEQLTERYSKIPTDTDILITHCPQFGILDQINANSTGKKANHLGNIALKNVISSLNLKLHVFGHIHGSYGRIDQNVNCSLCDENYVAINKTIIVEIS